MTYILLSFVKYHYISHILFTNVRFKVKSRFMWVGSRPHMLYKAKIIIQLFKVEITRNISLNLYLLDLRSCMPMLQNDRSTESLPFLPLGPCNRTKVNDVFAQESYYAVLMVWPWWILIVNKNDPITITYFWWKHFNILSMTFYNSHGIKMTSIKGTSKMKYLRGHSAWLSRLQNVKSSEEWKRIWKCTWARKCLNWLTTMSFLKLPFHKMLRGLLRWTTKSWRQSQ